MSDTPRMGLPLIEAAQAQKHVTHNEALVILDALAHLFLDDRDLADPPGSPADGEAWLVAPPASGAWAGQEGRIAFFIDGSWRFYPPFKGLAAYVADEQSIITFDGDAWSDFAALISPQNVPMLGVGTTADGANPFAARLNNALFTALEAAGGGDGDIRIKVNKEGAAGTASFLFQSGWSGRAEIGLCGDEDFHFKVSPDGSQWNEALTIDAATGALTSLGSPLWHGGNHGAGSGLDADLLDGSEAADLANHPAASQAEAEVGTEAALRSFSPLRLAQAIAAQAGGGDALEGIQRDIRLLALRQAATDGDRINMVDGIADPLEDASDIDSGGSTNIDTGTAGVIKPSAVGGSIALSTSDSATNGAASTTHNMGTLAIGAAAADRDVVVTGVTRFSGGVSGTISSVTIGGASATLDVNPVAGNIAWIARLRVPAGTTAEIIVSSATSMSHTGIQVYRMTGAATGTPVTGFSASTSSPVTLTQTVPAGGAALGCQIADSANVTGLDFTAGLAEDLEQSLTGDYVRGAHGSLTTAAELASQSFTATRSWSGGSAYFAVAIYMPAAGSINDMDCRSNAFAADAVPDTGRLHLQIGGTDAGTLARNTDLIGYVSRDGGATWTAASLAAAGMLADGTRIFEDSDIDLSAQPSGTSMKWRVATANGIDVALHGVVKQWM